MFPFVTIVIVTWNKRDDVINLLDSLHPLISNDINIIVVDNASIDGTSDAISRHHLNVILLENKENLGGTGGFNTGIRYALENLEQKYIWLLDNDAEVRPDTLEKLISAMESNNAIGIAGSCILDTADRGLIVEAGGGVDNATATWKPYLRYQNHSRHIHSPPIDVDYVPACSALVRKELFDSIGIMDERYFLHWDDVDFSRTAIDAGFRVVAVFDSMVYHGTEKGYNNTVLYFDVRNSLLFISKHLNMLQRITPMIRVCLRGKLAAALFSSFGEPLLAWYLDQAFIDFSTGQFGPSPKQPKNLPTSAVQNEVSLLNLSSCKKIVVFAVGSTSDIQSSIKLIHTALPAVKITLAAPADRIDAYRSFGYIEKFLKYDLARDGIWGCFVVGLKILFSRFDCAVSAGTGFIVPFAFLINRHVVVSKEGRRVHKSNVCLSSLWKLPFAMLTGLLTAVSLFLKCWQTSKMMENTHK